MREKTEKVKMKKKYERKEKERKKDKMTKNRELCHLELIMKQEKFIIFVEREREREKVSFEKTSSNTIKTTPRI